MDTRQLRALRGAAAATVAVIFAGVSHTAAGGSAPAWWLLASVAILSWPIATLLTSRGLGRIGLGAAVVLAQLLLHVVFAAAGGLSPGAVVPHHHGPADASMAGDLILSGTHALGTAGHGLVPDAPMLIAHLVAAAAAYLLLSHGESLIARIAGWVEALLRGAITAPLRVDGGRHGRNAVVRVPVAILRSPGTPRGPPVLLG